MALVRPFRGIRYNPEFVKDYSQVMCPPYDVISPTEQDAYYRLNKHNYIRIELTKELPGDSEYDNKYDLASNTLERWLEEGILLPESKPAIYIHEHYFTLEDYRYCRRSIIAAVRLEEWSKMIVRPHEGTLFKARSDREALLRSTKANTSPVFVMYEDQDKAVKQLLSSLTKSRPQLNSDGYDDEHHHLWIITEPDSIDALSGLFNQKPLYIADGHHRYESALKYKREQEAILGNNATGDEPFNYLMMEMVDFQDPGLVNLPPHRLVRGVSRNTINSLMPKLEYLFDITEVHLDHPEAWIDIEAMMSKSQNTCLALFGLGGDRIHIIEVKDHQKLNQMMPAFHSDLYNKLDVSIIDHVILEGLLGLTDMTDLSRIAFNHNIREIIDLVKNREYQLAIILRPMSPEVIKEVADANQRMPRKSTYFHPKLPSGLVLNRLF